MIGIVVDVIQGTVVDVIIAAGTTPIRPTLRRDSILVAVLRASLGGRGSSQHLDLINEGRSRDGIGFKVQVAIFIVLKVLVVWVHEVAMVHDRAVPGKLGDAADPDDVRSTGT